MNRITAFSNAKEFQALFGETEHGSRRNAILLALFKSHSIWEWCKKTNDWQLLGIKSMAEMKRQVFFRLDLYSQGNYIVQLKGWSSRYLRSDKYETDEYLGIPMDETASTGDFIRYINKETDKVYKMRSGKFLRKVILESEFGKALPEQVLTWMLEELVADWRVQSANEVPRYHLVIDTDFEAIYDRSCCCGSFGSCMTDQGYHTFYSDACVGAKAASLQDENDIIIARCIIYDAEDEYGKKWRLAERQYATKELHKQLLVNALIEGGHIDGYKRVGADCGAANSFVSNDGEDLSSLGFSIECNLDWGDTVSYQDSFKWYNMSEHKAYNYYECNYDEVLDITDGSLPGEWDDYHDRYARYTERAYYQGEEIHVDEDEMGDFRYFRGDYYHEDDIMECPQCGGEFLNPEYYDDYGLFYSKVTEEWYCDEVCRDLAEKEYKENWWHWAEFDQDYVEHSDELSDVLMWNDYLNKFVVEKVITININYYIKRGELFVHNSVLVDYEAHLHLMQQERACMALEELYIELKTTA